MNLLALRTEVEQFLMNTSADVNSLSWTISELNDYLNEGVFYTQQITTWFQEFANIVCTSSVGTYTGPNNVYQFLRMTWDRDFLPQTNEYELDRDDPSWRAAPPNNPFRFYFPQQSQNYTIVPYPTPSQTGTSYTASQELGVVAELTLADGVTPDSTYVFNQEVGIVIGMADTQGAILMFRPDVVSNPFPLGNFANPDLGELQIFSTDELNLGAAFIRYPDTLVADTDTPQLPAQVHYALVMYALMKCFVREGEFQDLQLAQGWFTAYGDWMESVLENKGRWWATRVRSLEPFEEGSLFAARLNAVGFPLQLDLKPSY